MAGERRRAAADRDPWRPRSGVRVVLAIALVVVPLAVAVVLLSS